MRLPVLLLMFVPLAVAAAAPANPPDVEQRPHVMAHHGIERIDPYYWLRDREDPAVIAYLEAENAYAAASLAHTSEFQETLYHELLGRIDETDVTVPYPRPDGYFYARRTEAGKSYPIFTRRKDAIDGDEVIIFDVNERARDKAHYEIGQFRVSPDGSILAFTEDEQGDDIYDLRFKDLQADEITPTVIEGVNAYSGQWSADGRYFFYTVLDEANRPFQVRRHELGSDSAADVVVYEESDGRYYVSLSKTQDGAFLLASSHSKTTTEFHFLRADEPEGAFRTLLRREPGVRYYPEHYAGEFIIQTDAEALNFKIMALPIQDPVPDAMRLIIPHRREVKIEEMLVLKHWLVVRETEHGQVRLRALNLRDHEEHMVQMPEDVYALSFGPNELWETTTLRLDYSSPITPDSVFDYDLESRSLTLLKERRIPSGHDRDAYVTRRLYAPGRDGARIPVTVTHRKETPLDGSAPLFIRGYGSYGYTLEPRFLSSHYTFIDRGFVVATAHVRGSSMLGEAWYRDGKLLNKKNTFNDFIDATRFLQSNGYGRPESTVIEGGSAGGLLIGAVINDSPGLYRAAHAAVPFVDVLTTMLDPSIPLTTFEYEEWGNPEEEAFFHYIHSYSPYDNVAKQDYPHLLVTTGINDPRVAYWEPAKWVAKLRDLKTDSNLLVMRTNLDAGHGGASGRYEALREIAFEFAFLLDRIGFTE